MSKRILVLSASVGAGHLRAAQAVELALRELAPEAHVENHDILQFTNAAFRRVYAQFYLDLVNKAPHVLGYFYDLLDKPVRKNQFSEKLRRLIQDLNLRKFVSFLKQTPWDLVVNTHGHMDHFGGIAQVTGPITAEVGIHELDKWVLVNYEERVVVATKAMLFYLEQAGVPVARRAQLIELYGEGKQHVRSVRVDFTLRDDQELDGGR